MTLNHFEIMTIFAIAVSVVFALLSKQTARDRLRYFVMALVAFLAVAIGIGWLMYPFSR
jgi:hypothetical protein